MSALTITSRGFSTRSLQPAPPCPGCFTALAPVDVSSRAFWLCEDCGTTMRRS